MDGSYGSTAKEVKQRTDPWNPAASTMAGTHTVYDQQLKDAISSMSYCFCFARTSFKLSCTDFKLFRY